MLKSQDRAITVAAQNARFTRRGFAAALVAGAMDARPNILWITCEDIGPALGCYGDKYADSPNIDKLAARGMMYRNAWSNAPVCAPARTTIISGVYPPSAGAEHMRSMTRLPASMKMYPCFLREAGYYATNNAKEDYNVEHTGEVWDESSNKAHWRKRKPGQPFMSVFNLLITHESQIRTRPHTWVHDPAKARIPAYHPDTPEVRQGSTPYEMGHDEKRYPLRRIMETAELASGLEPGAAGELTKRLADPDSAVRYWAAMGLLMRESVDGMRKALSDSSPNVRTVAAEALGRYGGAEDLKKSLDVLMELVPADKNGAYVSLLALNALESLGSKATPVKAALKTLELEDKASPARARRYGKTLAGNFN